jgi:hypothetical protein
MVSFTLMPFYPMDEPHPTACPLDWTLGLTQSQSGHGGEKKSFCPYHQYRVNTICPASYAGGPGFKYRRRDRLSWLRVFVVSAFPAGKCRNSVPTWSHVTTASFRILSNSSFTYHPFIRRCIIWVSEKASLNTTDLSGGWVGRRNGLKIVA